MRLSSRHSGYDLNKDDWIAFLNCWKEAVEKLPEGPSEGPFLRFSDRGNPSASLEIEGTDLPRSVLDFHEAYRELGGVYRSANYDDGIGIIAPDKIQPLSEYLPYFLLARSEWPYESSDEEYFRYGVEQDGSDFRTSYQNRAIVIGQYGFSDYEVIVLYPDSRTEDGEMETAILAHAYEGRTSSFAEMMRQLSFFFVQRSPEHIPLYAQERLKGTCADKLPLKDVWWK